MNPFDEEKPAGRSQLPRPYQWEEDDGPDAVEEIDSQEDGGSEGPSDEEPMQELAHHAGKRPRSSYASKMPATRHYERGGVLARDDNGVDLARYFRGVPHKEQVAICRAYASYLAAQNRGQAAAAKKNE